MAKTCEHEVVIRLEAAPPMRQPGPYVRWFCEDPDCAQEFVTIPKVGTLTEWYQVRKLRREMRKGLDVG